MKPFFSRTKRAADKEPKAGEAAEDAVQRLKAELGEPVRICILGGTSFQGADSEELVKAMAGELAKALGDRVAFITGGMAGVQKTFALSCGDGSRVWNLVPMGQSSGFGKGKDIHAGSDLEGRKEVFGLLGELYITVEGGPGVSQEARAAHARGAAIIPLARTGGASGGQFDFPAEALNRPRFATMEQWALLRSSQATVADAAVAVAEMAIAFLSHAKDLSQKASEAACEGAEAAKGVAESVQQKSAEAAESSQGKAQSAADKVRGLFGGAAASAKDKAASLEGEAATAMNASSSAAHNMMASAREALESGEGNVKDAAAKEAIEHFAPAPFGPLSRCFGVKCVMATLDKAEFVVPEDKRPQMRVAIDAYKAL